MRVSDRHISKAKAIIGKSPVRAAGYRLKIFLLDSEMGLDEGAASVAPTLKAAGFVAKSANQKEREDRGSDMAIVVDVGPTAYQGGNTGDRAWVEPGQVIRMMRYTGHRFEDPPGSGRMHGLINDEDVLGVYDENVLEAE